MTPNKNIRHLSDIELPPLNSSLRYNITVKPFFCSIANVSNCATRPPTLVHHNIAPIVLLVKNANIRIEDVVFEGGTTLVQDCLAEQCTYCRYTTIDPITGEIRDQLGKLWVPGTFAPLSICGKFNAYSFINCATQSSLSLFNVTFQNFRQELKSLIWIELGGLMTLRNVNFSKITVSPNGMSSAVIGQYQTPDSFSIAQFLQYRASYLVYSGGVVEYLNSGVDYRPNSELGGFIAAQFVGTLVIQNVIFRRNSLGVLKENFHALGGILGSLVFLDNLMHAVIEDCVFEVNYGTVGSLLKVHSTVLVWKSVMYSVNITSLIAMTHISIRNCVFRNNSAIDSLINVNFGADLQNIEIKQCTFEQSMVLQGSLISFQKSKISSTLERFGGFVTFNISLNLRYHVQYPPNRISISNCSFVSLFYETSLISFTNLTNIDIRNLSIIKCGDTVNENLFTTTFATLEQLGYVSQIGFATMASFPCLSGFSFRQSFNTYLEKIRFENITCRRGTAAISVESIDRLVIYDSVLLSNSEVKPSLNWITIRKSESVLLSHIQVSSLICEQSPIEIDSSTVIFQQCNFEESQGDLGGIVNIPALLNVTFHECNFTSNTASEGGAIYAYSNNKAESYLNIDSSRFVSNKAKGRGGVLEIAFKEMSHMVSIVISNTTLLRNTGDGVVHLQEGLILNCTITESVLMGNDGLQSSPLNLFFESGTISIENTLFENNIGLIASAIQNVFYASSTTRVVNLSSVVFKNHKGKMLIYVSALLSTLITSNVTFSKNSAQIVNLAFTTWRDSNSKFENNNSTSSVIQIRKNSFASLHQTRFLENMIELSGSCMSIDALSEVKCTECTFTGNTAQKYGGVAIIRQNSYVFFNSSVFLKNNANLDGAVLYFLGANTKSEIVNCTFDENSSNGGLISLLSSYLTISNSKIRNNTSVLASPGITLNLSNLTLTHSEFVNQKGNLGVFLALLGDSYVDIISCLFDMGVGETSSNAIAVLSSTLSIISSSFNRMIIENVLYIYNRSNVTLSQCSFASIREGGKSIVFAYDSGLSIQSSAFSDYFVSAVLGEKSNIEITSSTFSRGKTRFGAALRCITCANVSISYSLFDMLNAKQGGAMHFTSTDQSQIEISESSFTCNSAEDSGTIYAENVNLTLRNNEFLNGYSYSELLGRGGALTLVCPQYEDCRFLIISNVFRNNSAELKGGAIFWDAIMPILISDRFEGNSAIYGDDIASFPAKLIQIPDLDNRTISHLESISSGQLSRSLRFALVDHNAIIVATDSLSHATMVPFNLTQGAVKGSTQAQANRGIFTFSNYIISAIPGCQGNISVTSSAIKSEENNAVTLSVSLRKCEIGEMEEHNECIMCPSGTYSFGSKESCKQCPPDALCYGNYSIIPRAGYWRSSNTSDIFFQCFNKNSCLIGGRRNISDSNNCEDGYENHICQVCSEGYYYAAQNICAQCPSRWANYLKLNGTLFIFIIVLFVMVKSSLRSTVRPASTLAIYLKIALNYFQVVMLISTLDLSWPETLKNLFFVHQSIGGTSEALFSVDCLMEINVSAGYYIKLISISILPVGSSLILAVLWLVISCCKSNFTYMSHQLVASIIIVFFIFQPSIMKTSFSIFSCFEIEGSYWLKEIMSEKCWIGIHLKYALTAALPSIIVWSIALPAVCLSCMIRVRIRLAEPPFNMLFGFLFKGFKHDKFYWEFMFLGRKLLIVVISTFVRILSRSLQALTILLLLFIDIMLQSYHLPFVSDQLNRAEEFSTIVCASTLFIGLIFLLEVLGQPSQIFFFALVLLFNITLLVYLSTGPLRLGIAAVKTFATKHFSQKENQLEPHIIREELSRFSAEDLVAPDPSFCSITVRQLPQIQIEK